MTAPLGYLITWTAYGTWLYGDPRGWVMSGLPCILPADQLLFRRERERLAETEVEFDKSQRRLIEDTIDRHCEIRGWMVHARNARSNHVHLVASADREPEEVMNQLKAWCSRKLSDAAGLRSVDRAKKAGRRKWFTEHGSTMWINDEDYLANAIRYVRERQ